MPSTLWLLCAPLLTGALVGLLVAFLHVRDDPVLFFGLLAGVLLALAIFKKANDTHTIPQATNACTHQPSRPIRHHAYGTGMRASWGGDAMTVDGVEVSIT